MDKLSIVVPCFNEEEVLPKFYEKITEVIAQMPQQDFEILFIDDGSTDHTLRLLRKYREIDKRVRFISFSRNFGKEAGLYAGLQNATGDYVSVIDVDLQDPPELLPEMYEMIQEKDVDCVATRRSSRKGEPPLRSFFARQFYKLMNKLSKTDMVQGARDFRLMSRKMVDAILSLGEYNRFSKGIFGWVGFHTKWISYENIERAAGNTKWSFWSLFAYALDGIIAFSTAPLIAASIIGMIFCGIAFIMVIFFFAKTLLFGDPVAGYPSTICAIFFVGGIQLFCTGVLGQYLSKLYLEAKKRPVYIINHTEKDMDDV